MFDSSLHQYLRAGETPFVFPVPMTGGSGSNILNWLNTYSHELFVRNGQVRQMQIVNGARVHSVAAQHLGDAYFKYEEFDIHLFFDGDKLTRVEKVSWISNTNNWCIIPRYGLDGRCVDILHEAVPQWTSLRCAMVNRHFSPKVVV